jgi:hypothetical protein
MKQFHISFGGTNVDTTISASWLAENTVFNRQAGEISGCASYI